MHYKPYLNFSEGEVLVEASKLDEQPSLAQDGSETSKIYPTVQADESSEAAESENALNAQIETARADDSSEESNSKPDIPAQTPDTATPEPQILGDANVDANNESERKVWTQMEIQKVWRRFNIDLTPKILYCRGALVELLISSDIAKYCEFKMVSKILTFRNGALEPVG